MEKSEEILKQYGLSKTQIRVRILELMMDNHCALSEAELKTIFGDDCDRTTIYRTLKTFEQKELVYRVVADDGLVRYFLSPSENKELDHNHLHFRCVKCNRLVCLSDTEIPNVNLPDGFTVIKNNFVVDGICRTCGKV